MKRQLVIEMLDNGIVIKGANWAQGVLFNRADPMNDDAEFHDCQVAIGKLFTDQAFGCATELKRESDNMYNTTGKCTEGYRIEVTITPLGPDELKLKDDDSQ